MTQLILYVEEMRSRREVREVTGRLRDVSGVETITADPSRSLVRVGGSMTVEAVLEAFASAGYAPQLVGRTG